jgi:hypothetical protein
MSANEKSEKSWLEGRPIGKRMRPLADEFVHAVRLAKAAGLRGWEARQAADKVVADMTGVSVMKFLGIEEPRDLEGGFFNSTVQDFIKDACVQGPGLRVMRSELYEAFKCWAHRENEQVIGLHAFRRACLDIGFGETRAKEGRYWVGVEVREEA